MGTWQIQEAKVRVSEVVKKAGKEGPQKITVRGESAAVVSGFTWTNRPSES